MKPRLAYSETAPAPLGRKAWLFAAPAVIGLLAFFIFVAARQGLLNSKDRVSFMSNSANGITIGMPVKLNGFVIGAVDKLVLLPPSVESDLRVRVDLSIYGDYMRYIPKTTVARLVQEGLIGSSMIELLPKRYDARAIASGEMLQFERTRGLGEIAEQMDGKLTPVLVNTEAITRNMADPEGDFRQSLKAARALLEQMPATNAQLQKTLDASNAAITRLDQHANATLGKADKAIDTVNTSLPPLLQKAEATVGNLKDASSDIKKMAHDTAATVPEVVGDARQLAGDSARLVKGVSQSWPARMLAPQPESKALPVDSQQGLPPIGVGK